MFDFLTLYATAEGEEIAPADATATEGAATDGTQPAEGTVADGTAPVSEAPPAGNGLTGTLLQVGFIAILIIGLYFIMIRPQQKRQKKERELRENVQIGDTIVTIGGIVGIVTNIKEDNISIETGGGSKMVFKKFAIQTIETIHE